MSGHDAQWYEAEYFRIRNEVSLHESGYQAVLEGVERQLQETNDYIAMLEAVARAAKQLVEWPIFMATSEHHVQRRELADLLQTLVYVYPHSLLTQQEREAQACLAPLLGEECDCKTLAQDAVEYEWMMTL